MNVGYVNDSVGHRERRHRGLDINFKSIMDRSSIDNFNCLSDPDNGESPITLGNLKFLEKDPLKKTNKNNSFTPFQDISKKKSRQKCVVSQIPLVLDTLPGKRQNYRSVESLLRKLNLTIIDRRSPFTFRRTVTLRPSNSRLCTSQQSRS